MKKTNIDDTFPDKQFHVDSFTIYRKDKIKHSDGLVMSGVYRISEMKGCICHFTKWQTRQTQNICITFLKRRTNVFDFGPTLYKCFLFTGDTPFDIQGDDI